jgi:hypothetical protein
MRGFQIDWQKSVKIHEKFAIPYGKVVAKFIV